MAFYFEHVQLLGYDHSPIFLGAGLRYRVEKKLRIKGRLSSYTSYSGAQTIIDKETLVLDGAQDYQEVILNGISFGTGRVEGITFQGGTLVHAETYDYEITCFEEGDLSTAVSGVYSGLSWASPEDIESISESLSFESNEQNDATYQHEISVQYLNSGSVTNRINLAKALATIFFNATSGLGAFLGSYSNISLARKVHSESFDLVGGACSFAESAVIPATASGNYSYNVSYSLTLGQDGYSNIEETCSIQGLTSPPYAGASAGLTALRSGAFTRCNVVYNAYDFSNVALKTTPIALGISTNKFTGDIVLKTAFSNDPKYNTTAIWVYSLDASKDSQGYWSVSEKGSVIGLGAFNSAQKYQAAEDFFTATVSPNIASRCATFYQSSSGRSITLTKVGSSRSENRLQGALEYSVDYTDNSLFSTGDIKRAEYQISTSRATHLAKTYSVFNFKEIVQSQKQSTPSEISFDATFRGKRGTPLSTYLTAAKAFVNANLPGTTDRYISACDYSLSPETNAFSFKLNLLYFNEHKDRTDISMT